MEQNTSLFEGETRALRVLYKCNQVLQRRDVPVHAVLEEIVQLLPNSWQDIDSTCARIVVAEMEFATPNYVQTSDVECFQFTSKDGLQGRLEVAYAAGSKTTNEQRSKEKELHTMLADMISIYLSRRFDEDIVRKAESNQRAMVDNTNFIVWSVNRDYQLISFNKPFANIIKHRFGTTPQVGQRLTDGIDRLNRLRDEWSPLYDKALGGETFKITWGFNEVYHEYTLNPIIEDAKVIGATIFGEDITERLRLEKEMQIMNKRLAESRLMAIRAAMNPHFIFNCLNSIQYYIMENDQRSAVKYLSKFSKLIRATLDNSVHSKGRLSAAIDLIILYVELETLRFEGKFDFKLEIDPSVDIESIEIPSLLIQPYVENAIVHGLNNKKDKGSLRISFALQEKMLYIEVEDDGVGRKAAAEVKKSSQPEHRSLGVMLTEERLKLINGETGALVETVDLERKGVPSGTLVKILVKVVE
ncbi:histidine kinase [Chryseolinea sp. T2]|uniref:sensor histidine kinase n=1 Tax=Chryseolinea sp. T2 TaxID=3129255 RepID=UPI003077A0D3